MQNCGHIDSNVALSNSIHARWGTHQMSAKGKGFLSIPFPKRSTMKNGNDHLTSLSS